ncbi:MAG: SpoIID/LytB domain-containing protein, partial [Fusobacteriaceae bacterium]
MYKKTIISGVLALLIVACSSMETPTETTHEKAVSGEASISKSKIEISKDKKDSQQSLRKVDLSAFGNIPKSPKGVEFKYLTTASHLLQKKDYGLEKDEEAALEFYKRTDIEAYGDNASFYRWNFVRSEGELLQILEKNLTALQKSRPKDVLQFKNGRWEKASAPGKNPIGNLELLYVTERDQSGMALALLIKGSNGTYLVHNKYNLRKILGGGTYKVFSSMNNNRLLTNPTLIPSGFFAFEKKDGNYHFYGGGYGHGVGLSQAGAQDMTKNYGKNYKEVMSFYYPGTAISKFENRNIRVAITNTEKKLDHKRVTLTTIHGMQVKFLGKTHNIPGGTTLTLRNTGTGIEILSGGKPLAKGKGRVQISSQKSMLKLTSIKRKYKKNNSPSYHGEFQVTASGKDSLRIVNHVLLERYLENVVPSEMSPTFGVEPLKVQAIAARTYAVRFQQRNGGKGSYDVDDTTKYQAYNYVEKNANSTAAIQATKGMILTYGGKIADTKYYSVTSGYGASSRAV